MAREPSGLRVLVVEDEALVALDLEFTLLRHGFDVLGPAANVAEASRMLHEAAPDAAILDVNLGGEPVFPIADALATRGTPFVFTTGYDATILPEEHRGRPIVTKPCPTEKLIRLLTATLGIAR